MLLNFSYLNYVYLVVYVVVSCFVLLVNDFFIIWVVIEMQMIVFVSMAVESHLSFFSGLVSYFLFQSVSSISILVFFYLTMLWDYYLFMVILQVFFLINLGVFPFASWYVYSTCEMGLFILSLCLTFQNLPAFILLWTSEILFISNTNLFILALMSFNIFFCAFCSSSSTTTLFNFIWLSIASTFWLTLSFIVSIGFFFVYFLVYSGFVCLFIVSLSHPWNNSLFTVSLLSISGLPPFPDFFFNVYLILSTFYLGFNISLIFVILISLLFNVFYMVSFCVLIIKYLLFYFLDTVYSS